ncbi:MAG: aminopeptidase P family protein [Ignavibacteria bacterium]|nr:aminopeptidase P family protein [Ignavibacteria bacterium]
MPTVSQLKTAALRLDQLRKSMKSNEIDGLVITSLSSIRYLFGFSGSHATVIVTKKNVHFFTNDLYTIQVQKELYSVPGMKVHITRDVWTTCKELKIASTLKRVGFNSSVITVHSHRLIKKALAPAVLVETSSMVSPITAVKSNTEIKSIAEACRIVSQSYEQMLGYVQPGMTEIDVANYLAACTRELGSEKDAFDIIVVGGVRSAMPHGRASNAKLVKGMVITVDFGCCVDGLFSDMTRTFCLGTPSKEVVETFAVLLDAHLTALDHARAGITAAELDLCARDLITTAGFGENFKHSLGHGLGYDVHENPRVSWMNKNEKLVENNVITIEPGIYIPGKFGMRIEDDVVIKKNGCTILTTAPRELVVV